MGTIAARLQSAERGGQPLVDMLVPFHLLYGDGVERVAAESLLERQRWVNYLWSVTDVVAPFPFADCFLCKLKGCYSPSDDRSFRNTVTNTLHHRVNKNDTVLRQPKQCHLKCWNRVYCICPSIRCHPRYIRFTIAIELAFRSFASLFIGLFSSYWHSRRHGYLKPRIRVPRRPACRPAQPS